MEGLTAEQRQQRLAELKIARAETAKELLTAWANLAERGVLPRSPLHDWFLGEVAKDVQHDR